MMHRPSPPPTTLVLAQLRWSETSRHLSGLLDELAARVRQTCAAQPEARAIDHALELAIRDLKRDLRRFGDALSRMAVDATTRDNPSAALRELLDRSADLLPPADLVELMDRNGFLTLSLDATLKKTLADLDQLIRKESDHASRF